MLTRAYVVVMLLSRGPSTAPCVVDNFLLGENASFARYTGRERESKGGKWEQP